MMEKDKTSKALEIFKKQITIIEIKNIGLPKSLNIGIKQARSNFIIRVDSMTMLMKNSINNYKIFKVES